MRSVVFLAVVAIAWAADVPAECEWGESYWCSDIRVASQCKAVNHCMTTIWKNQKPQDDGSDVCTFCETVIGDLRKFMEDQQEQKTIQQYLEAACSIIPSQDLASKCRDIVDNYLPAVLDLLASELDPQAVCSAMGLCQGFADKVSHPPIQHPDLLQGVVPKDIPICADCKKFLQDIKEMLTSPDMEKQVEEYLDEMLCSQLGELKETCEEMVKEFVPILIDAIADEFDPAEACGLMGFCNATTINSKLLGSLQLTQLQQPKVNGEGECFICKVVFDMLKKIDQNKDAQKIVTDFIKVHFCAHLGSLQAQCNQSVDAYAVIVFELLVSELDPDTRCAGLGFCNSSQQDPGRVFVTMTKPTKPRVKTSAQCVLCEFVMKELEEMLESNATQSEIIAALDKVCDLLPDTISLQCKDFIDQYGPAILKLLEAEFNPDMVCTTLGLCSKPVKETRRLLKANGDEECGVCETVIQYLESLLEENATVQAIEQTCEIVCNFLPDTMKQECTDFIEEYTPTLILLITQYVDPQEFCTLLGLCGNQTEVKKPTKVGLTRLVAAQQGPAVLMQQPKARLGEKKCTWGPGYWCKNMDTAKECDMVVHCAKNYWGKDEKTGKLSNI